MTRSTLRRAAVAAALSLIVVGGTSSCGTSAHSHAVGHYCATLPDSVGLYVGNPVTQMGYPIGTIDTITPSDLSVRVEFTITADRTLPHDAKAVVRSTSILADRALELIGNYHGGPKLTAGQCIALTRSLTPKSLSEVIGSANTFVNGITPEGSGNISAAITQLNQSIHSNGSGINQILTTSSRLLNNPDGPISDMNAIVRNLNTLTGALVAMRDPVKQILNDAVTTSPDIVDAVSGAHLMVEPLSKLIVAVSDLETHAGDELQLTLNSVADAMRILSPHAAGLATLLDPIPWWINTAANHVNNREFRLLSLRPPLYRIRTPDGVAACNIMNMSAPGTCANVGGQPYAVDVNLLQYVFLNASR